jgi:hypothetical protein
LINPIKNYKDLTIENICLYTKKECIIIKIPFLRFEGFWLEDKYKTLNKFKSNTVSEFPCITRDTIDEYLSQKIDASQVITHFESSIDKLKEIESSCDVLFVDFFLENYKQYCMFKDRLHPTQLLLNFITNQLITLLCDRAGITNKFNFTLSNTIHQSGHFKPTVHCVKHILQLEYDLDTVYRVSQKEYLTKILEYDMSNGDPIDDYDTFYKVVFKI